MPDALAVQHEAGSASCKEDDRAIHCHSCNKDEQVPSGGAFVICPECFHVYPRPEDLKKAFLKQAWWHFKFDMKRGRRNRTVLVDAPDGGTEELFTWRPTRFVRLSACWFMIRWLFRDPNKISFCQECIHDF